MTFRRQGGDHHRRFGLPEQLPHDRADRAYKFSDLAGAPLAVPSNAPPRAAARS